MIPDFLAEAIAFVGVQAYQLDPEATRAATGNLRTQFGIDIRARPWDSVHAPQGKQKDDGWSLIAGYVGSDPVLLWDGAAKQVWMLACGDDLHAVLEECPAMEFYVCDPALNYLLCSNDHNYVIGWGRAGAWVDRLPP